MYNFAYIFMVPYLKFKWNKDTEVWCFYAQKKKESKHTQRRDWVLNSEGKQTETAVQNIDLKMAPLYFVYWSRFKMSVKCQSDWLSSGCTFWGSAICTEGGTVLPDITTGKRKCFLKVKDMHEVNSIWLTFSICFGRVFSADVKPSVSFKGETYKTKDLNPSHQT